MMTSHELPYIISQGVEAGAFKLDGDVYFLDKKTNEKKIVDFLYEDENGDLILTESKE